MEPGEGFSYSSDPAGRGGRRGNVNLINADSCGVCYKEAATLGN